MKALTKTIGRMLTAVFCLSIISFITPTSLSAQPGPGEKEYCFCTTPRNNQAASGTDVNGNPSVVKITWRGVTYMYNPVAGETAEDVMNALRAMIAAANPGDVVGPVTVDAIPAGRAVFCVKGPKNGIKQVKARETDTNFKWSTFKRVHNDRDPFLRGVTDALVSVEPLGGAVILEMLVVSDGGDESYISAVVLTQPGQTDLTSQMINALTDLGLDAELGEYDLDDDGVEDPAIFISRGIYQRLEGIGMATEDPGIETTTVVGLDDDCIQFDTAPVDLTKSFAPVPYPDGVQDRVQVKWYKASPQIKYSDEDAAACDIKFWPKRFLDVENQVPIGPPIENPDTVIIEDVKKTYPDGSPREIFKWPIKFRADGANNSNRVDPAIRYEWQVRCACYCGQSYESPWSEIKIFNTPDFDPITGIHPTARPYDWPEADEDDQSLFKSQAGNESLLLFPNPNDGSQFQVQIQGEYDNTSLTNVRIVDMTGKMVYSNLLSTKSLTSGIQLNMATTLNAGAYILHLENSEVELQHRLLVK